MTPYEGNEPYIFVSYAHADSERVLPILEALAERGFRLWYDAGIEDGAKRFAAARRALEGCRSLLIFVSARAVESADCRNALDGALTLRKEVLALYAETPASQALRYGWGLRLGKAASLCRADFPSETAFVDAIAAAEPMGAVAQAEVYFRQGERLYYGDGVTQSFEEALSYFHQAADLGHLGAQNCLGNRYLSGEGVTKDDREAARWFRRAAERGHAPAQYNLAKCRYFGRGAEQDYAEAVTWFRRAAAQGLAEAQFSLGVCYQQGEGVSENVAEAIAWYRKAIAQDHAGAQYALGHCYDEGDGVEQDSEEAAYWYLKAAEQGYGKAQLRLGEMYLYGVGVEKSRALARHWLREAAKQGNPEAKDILRRLGIAESE